MLSGFRLMRAGAQETLEAYKEGIKAIGINFEDISEIVITHVHLDHFGLAGKLKELSGAKLALHESERYFIELGRKNFEQVAHEMKEWLYQNGTPEENIPRAQLGISLTLSYTFLA